MLYFFYGKRYYYCNDQPCGAAFGEGGRRFSCLIPNLQPKESKDKMKDNNKEIYVNNKVNINNHLNDQIGSDNDLNK